MTDKPDTYSETAQTGGRETMAAASDFNAWFVREILPLEEPLLKFLRRGWRNDSDIRDLCHDVYIEIYEAAKGEIPKSPKAFAFSIARNVLIDRIRRTQVVAIEAVADLDDLGIALDEPSPERAAIARQDLHRFQVALGQLPPRWREVITMRKIHGLTRSEIAVRLGMAERTVSLHLASALVALANLVHGEPSDRGGK
jgi:RNA polymerase sigma-70 factor (ECF subfamily)